MVGENPDPPGNLLSLFSKLFLIHDCLSERAKGIEPSSTGWKPVALPLSYTREIIPSYDTLP